MHYKKERPHIPSLREHAPHSCQNPDQTDDKQVGRIIDIEYPLHLPACSPGAVVKIENRQRQQGAELEQTVDPVHGKEI